MSHVCHIGPFKEWLHFTGEKASFSSSIGVDSNRGRRLAPTTVTALPAPTVPDTAKAAPLTVQHNGFGEVLLVRLDFLDVDDKWPACKSMTRPQAQAFLDRYRRMKKAGPFTIECPSSDSVLDDMLSTHPILFLSILLTGSSSEPVFEKQADNLFRHVLADRVIVRGQKSLELLQGLLTYMTWYHHRFDQQTMQFYQFLQLTNGMMNELGLPKKFRNVDLTFTHTLHDLNELRTILLCFYLNCGGGVLGFDRPEGMRCISSLRNAAQLLARTSEDVLDQEAVAFVELLYIVAQHHDAGGHTQTPLELPASAFDQLQQWSMANSSRKISTTLQSTFHFCAAYSLLKFSGAGSPSSERVRTCTQHLEDLLSNILDQQITYLPEIGIVEWAHLITTLFLLTRLAPSAVNNEVSLHSTALTTVLHYVKRFQWRLRDLLKHSETNIAASAPHLFNWLEKILSAVETRANAGQTVRSPNATQPDIQESAYELVNSFLDEEQALPAPGQQGEPSLNTRKPQGDDFWSEFMSDWLNW